MIWFRKYYTTHELITLSLLISLIFIIINMPGSQQENQFVSKGLIASFFQDTEALKDYYSNYKNTLAELKFKIKPEDFAEKASDFEKQNLKNYMTYIRFFVIRTYLSYSALKDELKEFQKDFEAIEKLYERISEAGIPLDKDTEQYIILISKAFVKGVVAEYLVKSQEVYSNLVQGEEN